MSALTPYRIGEALDTSYSGLIDAFTYKPFLGDLRQLFESIRDSIHYLTDDERKKLTDAFDFMLIAHHGQTRLSGEQYALHPLKAMELLLELHPDITTLIACLLHDTIEDTPVTADDIRKKFGEDVAHICEGVSKVSSVRYAFNDSQLETLIKTFLAMSKDLRVIFVKFADRLHNIQTLDYHPREDKKKRIAMETMKIYVPLAKKLGLYSFAVMLENGAFRILEPGVYEEIISYCLHHFGDSPQAIADGKKMIEEVLINNHIPYIAIKGRLKSPYRIYEKLYKKYKIFDVSKVTDVLAFRVITDTVGHCYEILGHVHSKRRPLIHKIKDYISIPKFNNYQSLHTTVLGMFHYPVEIQIRTQNMEDIAEYGVAAHYIYSSGKDMQLNENQANRIKSLQQTVQEFAHTKGGFDSAKLKESLSTDFLTKSVFVYTPKGDIIELPQGSTVLDFAFRIHSDVGLGFKNAIVNGVIKPITYEVKTGDVISINTFSNKKSATAHWMDFLRTTNAKHKLQKYLRESHAEEYKQQGRTMLNEKLKERGLPLLGDDDDRFTQTMTDKELGDLYLGLAMKQHSPGDCIRPLYKDLLYQLRKKPVYIPQEKTTVTPVIVDFSHETTYRLCEECKPKPTQAIIAISSKRGVVIHTLSCPGVYLANKAKTLEAHRADHKPTPYIAKIILTIPPKTQTLVGLLGDLASLGRDSDELAITKEPDGSYQLSLTIILHNPNKISAITAKLHKLNDSYRIRVIFCEP
ncbi:MAG: RelA/SpoT family protein [Candidatus Absconditabacterales bacterium]|nr:RelA/SpoT family protein [Candidatus Absconditabacterales bacterium]